MVYNNGYDNELLDLWFYWFGWRWGWAIKIIKDSNGEIKKRLTKCKKKDEFPETEMFKWEQIDPEECINLLESGGHVNFKRISEVKVCYSKLVELFEE